MSSKELIGKPGISDCSGWIPAIFRGNPDIWQIFAMQKQDANLFFFVRGKI